MTAVFLYADHTLFGSAIKRLLDEDAGLVVVGWDDNPERAAQRIGLLHPDVVVVVTRATPEEAFATAPQLTGCSPVKVVFVSLDRSMVVASSGERCRVEEVGDFIRALE